MVSCLESWTDSCIDICVVIGNSGGKIFLIVLSWFCPFPDGIFSVSSVSFLGTYPSLMHNISQMKRSSTWGIPTIQKRWLVLKTHEASDNYEIIEDLAYMIHVTRTSDIHTAATPDICYHMTHIVSMIRSRRKGHHNTEKVIVIIRKYIWAVRIYLMTARIDCIILYRRLFESTMIAILREVENIERKA